MAKNRNLKYQFKNVIDRHFVEGMDKHSIKKNRDMNGERIFSYSDRKNLIDLSCSFANYMKNGAFHTLRKNYATNKYLEYRQKGLSIKEALKRVSINLGHGANRNKLMQQYICCAIE